MLHEPLVLENQFHVLVHGANRSDGTKAADGQQVKRRLPQQMSQALRFFRRLKRLRFLAVWLEAHISSPVTQDENREGPR